MGKQRGWIKGVKEERGEEKEELERAEWERVQLRWL